MPESPHTEEYPDYTGEFPNATSIKSDYPPAFETVVKADESAPQEPDESAQIVAHNPFGPAYVETSGNVREEFQRALRDSIRRRS